MDTCMYVCIYVIYDYVYLCNVCIFIDFYVDALLCYEYVTMLWK